MSSIWNSALNYLSRREYSRWELKSKLERKFSDEDEQVIEEVLDRLENQSLQSDSRYAEMWFRSQLSKGRGPIRIQGEARQKGIQTLISSEIENSDVDWSKIAYEILARKFAGGLTQSERAKAYRFLSYRGFDSDSIRHAIENTLQNEN